MNSPQDLNALVGRLRSGEVPPVEVGGQPILCLPVYETTRSQAELYLLRRGQKIPAHQHSAIDDVFVGVAGSGHIRIWDAHGNHNDHPIQSGSLVVVEPGTPHEVSCDGDEFCYVLTQSPKEHYDIANYKVPDA
jgi:quercetin dioxygenase-like cupin family protein